MSAFPVLPYTYNSRIDVTDGRELTRAVDGTAAGRSFWTARKLRFQLDFAVLESAEYAALLAHYNANRNTEFDFVWRDGVTYIVVYGKNDLAFGLVPPDRYSGKIVLEEL